MSNLTEGPVRFSNCNSNKLVISEGSTIEYFAILEYFHDIREIGKEKFNYFFNLLKKISRLLLI